MTGRKRFGALLLCIGLILVLSVSVAFIAHEADHDCCGEDCPICQTIAVNISLLRTLGLLILPAFRAVRPFHAGAEQLLFCGYARQLEDPA